MLKYLIAHKTTEILKQFFFNLTGNRYIRQSGHLLKTLTKAERMEYPDFRKERRKEREAGGICECCEQIFHAFPFCRFLEI